MKKSVIFLCFFILLLSACDDGSYDYGLDRYYEEIVTVIENNTFQLDNGQILLSTKSLPQTIEKGKRLFLHYTVLDEQVSSYDHVIRINGYNPFTEGLLRATSQKEITSLKKDPILFQSLWIGSHFLNMQFYLNFHSQTHSVTLVVDELLLDADPVEIYFKHDTNNDPDGAPIHTYLSFDLKEVLGEPQQNKQIRIFVNTSNYGEKAYDLIY